MDCLKRGEHGSRVRELQQLLRRPGYAVDIDGDFGRKTCEAVRAFHSQNFDAHAQPLVVDGKVGPLTWWSITHPVPEPAVGPIDFMKVPPVAVRQGERFRKRWPNSGTARVNPGATIAVPTSGSIWPRRFE